MTLDTNHADIFGYLKFIFGKLYTKKVTEKRVASDCKQWHLSSEKSSFWF